MDLRRLFWLRRGEHSIAGGRLITHKGMEMPHPTATYEHENFLNYSISRKKIMCPLKTNIRLAPFSDLRWVAMMVRILLVLTCKINFLHWNYAA